METRAPGPGARRQQGSRPADVADAAVRLTDLSRSYREGERFHPVLRGASTTIHQGECVALLGRSGSGKSTLLNLIAGIDTPDAGEVVVGGVPVTRLTEPGLTRFRRRHIGFVYQFFNLLPTLRVRENIALPLELNHLPSGEIERRTRSMLAAVELESRADAFPDRLSGGEQQRIAIARALVHRPDLVLADEPTGNLDRHSCDLVLELMLSLTRQQGGSLLLVTHSPAVARRADRLLVLEEGRLSEPDSSAITV
ncbi:MAG TPA: ABC transporter ATP-binding protein [Sedimenticola thiotaurini]|uniref:ABC transporter ATP-binding protein n=1 Tax=Sedimenticola thiotaurini TaxID=1543721 RepID=A0A831RM99_9GAMM|nr:ABC transporter ATP-binding protein [Sedimenticola thiotaurini]